MKFDFLNPAINLSSEWRSKLTGVNELVPGMFSRILNATAYKQRTMNLQYPTGLDERKATMTAKKPWRTAATAAMCPQ